jgi:hypothetical protein
VSAPRNHQAPWHRFDTCVRRYAGDRKIKTFPCSEHLRGMAFAQLTYRESLRDIETCLRAVQTKWYHPGLRGGVSRNNLANANRVRDWRIYADLVQKLAWRARRICCIASCGRVKFRHSNSPAGDAGALYACIHTKARPSRDLFTLFVDNL